MKPFLEALKERILVGDGAMGTMLQEGGLPEGGCPEESVLSRPRLILSIHERYIDAGADIIETNTFGANRYKLAEYRLGAEVERINCEAVRLAREASKGRAYVAGSVGPLGKQLAPIGDLKFGEAVDAFREQLKALARAGVDLVFLETISDLREAKAALVAAGELPGLPVAAHMTFGEGGRTLAGTPADVAAVVLSKMGAVAVGANCSTGPKEMLPVMESMAAMTASYLSVFPNAGLPELVGGKTVFRETPEDMAKFAERFVALGINIIGGCCGTTPAHISDMAQAVAKGKPVARSVQPRLRLCSRTRMVALEPAVTPLIIGERINLSVRKQMARAFIAGDAAAMREAAVEQVRRGANILDLNVGVSGEALGLERVSERKLMERAVRLVQQSVDAPLSIDSNNPEALEAGLQESDGRPIINSIPAEEEKMQKLLPLARRYGAAIVILPLSGRGIPDNAAERVQLAERVRSGALEAGIALEDILVDPLVMALSAAPEQGLVTLETLKLLKGKGCQTVLGLSNISFGLPERSILNASFLSMAMGAGLDLVILNPLDEPVMRSFRAGRVLTMSDRGAREFIAGFKIGAAAAAPAAVLPKAKPETIRERLLSAIVAGDRDGVIPHIEEALGQGVSPLEINVSMLAPALEEVGRRFEKGELFLPQMILAAETVQNAFVRLRQEMKGEKMPSKGKIVMATVRGDVHDIGKNICCTVLENYGYEISDLGRNVPAEVIIERAASVRADIIGLSALMTTTMRQMELVIVELRKRGMSQRVMVGGAVVTASYAKKIGADGYAKNAGEIVRLVNRLIESRKP